MSNGVVALVGSARSRSWDASPMRLGEHRMSKFPVSVASAFDPPMAGDGVLVGTGSSGGPVMFGHLVIRKKGTGTRM